MDALSWEVADKWQLPKEAKSSRMDTLKRAALLEFANRTLCTYQDNVKSTIKAREAQLDQRICDIEKENSELLERISV